MHEVVQHSYDVHVAVRIVVVIQQFENMGLGNSLIEVRGLIFYDFDRDFLAGFEASAQYNLTEGATSEQRMHSISATKKFIVKPLLKERRIQQRCGHQRRVRKLV
jgi:hypothetical protein